MASKPETSKVGAERAKLFKLLFANPISGLTPARLIGYLNAYNRGDIRQAVLLWQQIMERDDMVKVCDPKRRRAVTALNWEILAVDDSAEAEAQQATLKHFYNNLSAYDGLNEMKRGGVPQLLKQMLSAIGLEYAVHEIIWKPGAPGGLTADFKFLPLQFFENTTGRLRFLRSDHEQYGADLDEYFGPGGWMCNTGEGLMVATSIAYLFKTPTGLKAWVSFMEKFGMPGVHATTSAAKDSTEWDDLVEAVSAFGEDLALVTNEGAKIIPIEIANAGQAPHAPLVDRMDRALSRIWMGGDLATMSAGQGAVGSNPQGDDLENLKIADASSLTDALQFYVDRQVIRMVYGEEAPVLAYFKLQPPSRIDTEREIRTDEFLIKSGIEVGKEFLREKYNRPKPEDDEELATQPAAAPSPFGAKPPFSAANEQVDLSRRSPAKADAKFEIFRAQALRSLSAAQAAALRPLTDRLSEILGIEDEASQDAALLKLQNDLPGLLKTMNADPALITAWENIFATALVSGATEARAEISTTSAK